MADEPDRQLDLLSAVDVPPAEAPPRSEKLAVWWAEVQAPGRLGHAAWPGSGMGLAEDLVHLRDHHRASVLLAVADEPAELLEAAATHGLDLRQLRSGEHGEALARHASGLAADLRAGRRAVVVSTDASAAALTIACALIAHGKSVEEALDALGGSSPDSAALHAFVAALSGAPAIARTHERVVLHGERTSGAGDARVDAAANVAGAAALEERAPEGAESDAEEGALAQGSAPEQEALEEEALEEDARKEEETGALADRGPALARTRMEPPLVTPSSAERVELDRIARSPRSSRLAGAVLGAAIGDAMGHPTEFIASLEAIRSRFGPDGVTRYELWRDEGGRQVAPYTDDTQMAECVLRALLWGREQGADLDRTMRDLAERFVAWSKSPQGGHRAPGNACLAGCRNLERGVPWQEAGGATAGGCGSVMRAYPFGLLFAHDLERAEAWAVAHSKLTHRDPIALAASAAMAVGMARIVRDEPVATVLSEMVAAACRYSPKTAEMMARAIDEAWSGIGPDVTLERLQGWAAHEAIAAALYIFARHPDDPRAAILEGANTPGDSDSLATLAGALVCARTGVAGLPAAWVRDLERSDALIALALSI